MTPTLSLLLVCALVAALTLTRWPGRRNLQTLPITSRRIAVLVHLGVCGLFGLVVWLFTISIGTPLTDYLGVLGLLVLESLVAGLVSCLVLFAGFGLHIPSSITAYFREIADRNGLNREKEPEEVTRLESSHKQLPPGMKVVYSAGKGRWTDYDRAPEEEPNSRIG
jgi:nitrate reductase NapE component